MLNLLARRTVSPSVLGRMVRGNATVTAPTAAAPTIQVVKKKSVLGSIRGGILGFLLGATTAGAAGFAYLLSEYQAASGALLTSVEDLQTSTGRVREYARKIEGVNRELRELREKVATLDKVNEARTELRALQEMQAVEHLELAAKVRDLERDLAERSARK